MTAEQKLRVLERTIDILARHQLSIALNQREIVEQLQQGTADYSLIKANIDQDIALLQQVKQLSKQ